ncbi:MAG: FtsB family cell division protein [Acidimicrobiales bacterium]
MKRAARAFLASVTVVGVLLLFVLPGRTLLDQRRSISSTEARIHVLSAENQKLTERASQLQSDSEIERIARQQYGLVKPGERAVAILPSPAPTTTAPPRPTAKRGGGFLRSLEFWR